MLPFQMLTTSGEAVWGKVSGSVHWARATSCSEHPPLGQLRPEWKCSTVVIKGGPDLTLGMGVSKKFGFRQ